MKVTFVSPRSSYFYDRTPYLPLGIAYLIANITDFLCDIECIDGQILSEEDYEQAVESINSDVLCISATLLQMKEAIRIAILTKKRLPSIKIIVGGYGPHSLSPEELFRQNIFDIFVHREGEITLRDVLTCLEKDGDITKISNVTFLQAGKIKQTGVKVILPDLDSLPFPARDFFNIKAYLDKWRENTGLTSLHLIASRGCPFNCVFCDKSITGRNVRFRTPRLVVDEVEQLVLNYSPDDLFFFDDLFTLNKEWVLAVCREISRRRLKNKWSAQGKVGIVDLEMLSAMKEAGCTELLFGVESGSNKILSFLKKGFTREEVIKTFIACREVGLRAGAYLIIGVPGERKEDIDLTIDLVRKIRPSLLNFSFLTPFPNTKLYHETSQWIEQKDWTQWDDFTKTVYNYPFEVDPTVSRKRIISVYKQLIEEGLDYSTYQLIE